MTDTAVTDTPPPVEGDAPPEPEGTGDGQAPETDVLAALKELGVEPDKDGKIDPADHVKLVSTLKTLREQIKTHEAAERKATEQAEAERKKALPEQERLLEEARKAGREEALKETHAASIATLVTAMATASNFADPADAKTMLNLEELADEAAVRKAVAALATSKPYLLKPAPAGARLEQGPRGTGKSSDGTSGDDFLRNTINRKRAG
jgi:membrane protein involved in colicin uptake